MNRSIITSTILSLLLITSACGMPTADPSTSPSCEYNPPHPQTSQIQADFARAEAQLMHCRDKAELQLEICLLKKQVSQERCNEEKREQEWTCELGAAKLANKIPVRLCGAKIFVIDNTTKTVKVYEGDTDGDGVSNWHEFWMKSNPCAKRSFSGCKEDGDYDYDKDEKNNKEDDLPLCNPNDPSGNQADCV